MTRTSPPIRRARLALKRGTSPAVVRPFVRRTLPVPSPVYDTYWRFAHARQEVFFRRLKGDVGPWTTDPTLRAHRFTNVYRASDRVSQYLIRSVIHPPDVQLCPRDLLFRVLLFKFFNRIDTWELLEANVGRILWGDYSFAQYDRVLTRAIEGGRRIYSAAYIMPACVALSEGRKHRGHLRLIERLIEDGAAERLRDAGGLAEAFTILQEYPMMGDFLAFQYAIDINYSSLVHFPESEFVVAGPGARDGLRKVFLDPGGYSDADLIRWVNDRQEVEFERMGLAFRTLWGRRMQLIDCQNVFCEVDKYARVHHPEVAGRSGRTRIKQRFSPAGTIPTPWFPPRWGLNDLIANDRLVKRPPTQ